MSRLFQTDMCAKARRQCSQPVLKATETATSEDGTFFQIDRHIVEELVQRLLGGEEVVDCKHDRDGIKLPLLPPLALPQLRAVHELCPQTHICTHDEQRMFASRMPHASLKKQSRSTRHTVAGTNIDALALKCAGLRQGSLQGVP